MLPVTPLIGIASYGRNAEDPAQQRLFDAFVQAVIDGWSVEH